MRVSKLYVCPNEEKTQCAQAVTDIIMNEYEPKMIEKSVREYYGFLEEAELGEIVKIAKEAEAAEQSNEFPPFSERRAHVLEKVDEYFESENSVVPLGFADFRLKELRVYAEAIATYAADEYFARREYDEAVDVLRTVITLQPIREKIIHVLWKDDCVRLFNRFKRDVTDKYESDFYSYSISSGIKAEDLAISGIVLSGAKSVMLHNMPPSSPLGKTLMKIYGSDCTICQGCHLCGR